ncbi:hypothetical protein D3C71_1377780 [compost metagenome]
MRARQVAPQQGIQRGREKEEGFLVPGRQPGQCKQAQDAQRRMARYAHRQKDGAHHEQQFDKIIEIAAFGEKEGQQQRKNRRRSRRGHRVRARLQAHAPHDEQRRQQREEGQVIDQVVAQGDRGYQRFRSRIVHRQSRAAVHPPGVGQALGNARHGRLRQHRLDAVGQRRQELPVYIGTMGRALHQLRQAQGGMAVVQSPLRVEAVDDGSRNHDIGAGQQKPAIAGGTEETCHGMLVCPISTSGKRRPR